MKDYSIEYGHIYTDKEFCKEQIDSIVSKNEMVKKISLKGGSFETVVMIDDYSPIKEDKFDYGLFYEKLNEYHGYPNVLIRESELFDTNLKVIDLMKNNSLKKQLVGNIEKNGRHTCSLFISSWYMIRLGLIDNDFGISPCRKLINILDEKHSASERNAKQIISNVFGKITLNRIQNIYL